jgi:YHS domain-containing protein
MKQLLACGVLVGLAAVWAPVRAADKGDDPKTTKEALQALQDFIGEWKGTGGLDKPRPSPRDPIWKESLEWTWKFKGDDPALTINFKDGKNYKSGEMRYLLAKKLYQLTLTTKDDKQQVFTGPLDTEKSELKLERVDPDTKQTQQVTMNTAAEGVRFIFRMAHKDEGRTLYKKDFLVQATRVGQSLGAEEAKNICVVTGGLGKFQVSYNGETFWVCCSGCAEAFKENPTKYIAEFKAKKNMK